MKFRTEYIAEKSLIRLDPTQPIALIGSCFADNMASKMRECQWAVFGNAGTLYNPMSIAKVLKLFLFGDDSDEDISDSMFESEGYVYSWLFDSHFSRKEKAEVSAVIKEAGENLRTTLENAQALIVTFGTAWCYYLDGKSDYIVANCHKMPQTMFDRRRVSVEDISATWTELCDQFREKYPNLSVIFTVSPVRHLKDGFEGNSRSKATLVLAVEEICKRAENAIYFPAFEIVNDDLRDYRFYASDLVHPSEMAVDYLWEIFQSTFLDAEGIKLLKEGNKAYKRLNHRPIKN